MPLPEAKVFQNGQSQAVRIPKEFRMEGKSVYIRHFGAGVLLVPKHAIWDIFEDGLRELDVSEPLKRDQSAVQERDEIF